MKGEKAFSLYLAPMSSYNDVGFRVICRQWGFDVVFTGMISAEALWRGSSSSASRLKIDSQEAPVVVQLFGADPTPFAEVAPMIEEKGAQGIDINLGCPVPKVTRTGAGAALMEEPRKVASIVRALVKSVRIPVSAKLRAGLRKGKTTATEIARIVQEEGGQMVTVHPRFANEGFDRPANWNIIGEVKAAVRIKVTGNGDVRSWEDALKMREITGCDGVMVGRAALGRPWGIRPLREKPTAEEAINRHIELLLAHHDERYAVLQLIRHLPHYTRGMKGARKLRSSVSRLKSLEAMRKEIAAFFSSST